MSEQNKQNNDQKLTIISEDSKKLNKTIDRSERKFEESLKDIDDMLSNPNILKDGYKILSNYPIIPSTYLKDISAFIDLMIEVYNNEPRPPFADKNEEGYIHLNALIYNNAMIDSGQKSNEHIYNIKVDKEKIALNQDLKTYKTLFGKYYLSSLSSEEEEKAVSESIKLIKENKVKK